MCWTLRSGVCALSEVSMNNVRFAVSRRSIVGLTRTRKKFGCCSNRCSALASSATSLRRRYNSSAYWRIYYTLLILPSFSWVVTRRMSFKNILLITNTCFPPKRYVPTLRLFLRLPSDIHLILIAGTLCLFWPPRHVPILQRVLTS